MAAGTFASTVIVTSTVLAIVTAAVLRFDKDFDFPLVENGLPMSILLSGALYYVLVDQGLTGILSSYAEAVIIGVIASGLTAFIQVRQG